MAPGATAEQVEAAYFQQAKTWHPDRLPAHLREHRESLAKIFARMSEAHRTLCDPQQRQDYDRLVAQGGGTGKDKQLVDRIVDSAMVFRKAEVLLKRGLLDKAEPLLKQAVGADPDQPEYLATLAWVQGQLLDTTGGGSQSVSLQALSEQLSMLDRAVDMDPNFERALFYRAELLKRAGAIDRAIKDYRAAAKLNPRNIDAAREIRLYDMRKQPGDDEPGGLFGKLFSRNK